MPVKNAKLEKERKKQEEECASLYQVLAQHSSGFRKEMLGADGRERERTTNESEQRNNKLVDALLATHRGAEWITHLSCDD